MAECKLKERECVHCGECDRCDLNPDKLCDNCCLCLEDARVDYASIPVAMPAQGESSEAERGEVKSVPRKRRQHGHRTPG